MAVAADGPARRKGAVALLRDAAMAAAVALVLAIPLIGFETVEVNGGLTVATRFSWVAIAVAVVFFGRLALGAARGRRAARPPARTAPADSGRTRRFALIAIAVAVVLPLLPLPIHRTLDTLAINVLIYVMLGWGLNVVVGLAGLLDLGYVAFFAVGAYSFALAAHAFGLGFWTALPLSGLLAASFGCVLGFPVLRLRGDYLAIVTLGFGEIIRIVLQNWTPVTGGPGGLSNIPAPTLFGLSFTRVAPQGMTTFHEFFGIAFNPEHKTVFLYYVILALALVTNWFTLRLRRLPIGRAWEALREDEIACRSLGINPTAVKLSAFTIGAMLAGFAGAFFASQQTFINPNDFTFTNSAMILAIVVLGGMGSQFGVVLAAIVLGTLPVLGQELGNIAADLVRLRMLIFGAAMIGIMVWRPGGLIAQRCPSILLAAPDRSPT